jgi:hypothetical protein
MQKETKNNKNHEIISSKNNFYFINQIVLFLQNYSMSKLEKNQFFYILKNKLFTKLYFLHE